MDFRDASWNTVREQGAGREFAVDLPRSADLHVAYFAELIFNDGTDNQFSLSTNIEVIRHKSATAGGN
jgi:hypothetical protein